MSHNFLAGHRRSGREIRNPKLEIRNKSQIRNQENADESTSFPGMTMDVLNFGFSGFGICFGFRIWRLRICIGLIEGKNPRCSASRLVRKDQVGRERGIFLSSLG